MSTINNHKILNNSWLAARSSQLIAILLFATHAAAQSPDAHIRSGNRYYKQKLIDQSQKEYQEAVRQTPDDPTANYNLGNTQFRKNSYDESAKSYQTGIDHSPDSEFREKSLYNQGVALVKGQKLQESIDAWKNALKINPADTEARENLQKALMELKQQQQQQKKDQKDKKDQKEKKDQKDQPKKQEQPKPQPSKLNKQQVEQLLKALQQKENDVQEKMNQNKAKALTQPDKDW